MKVALVIGHSRVRKGAWGNMGISEYDFYSKFVPELLKRLDSEHTSHEFMMFERSPDGQSYTERMKELHSRIDKWGADLSLSFHFNAAGDERVNGHEILYCSNAGHNYAVELDELFDAYLDNRDRNIKQITLEDRGGGFVCRGRSVCLLLEPFFASHQNKYVTGGEMRVPLINAITDFIISL